MEIMDFIDDGFNPEEPREKRVFKTGQAKIKFKNISTPATFYLGDCMKIKDTDGNIAFFQIEGFRKIKLMRYHESPPGAVIYKILGKLYQQNKNYKWRRALSSIDYYYSKTRRLFFTHNNRSRRINIDSIFNEKVCPSTFDKDKKFNNYIPTLFDNVGNDGTKNRPDGTVITGEEKDTIIKNYNNDYKLLETKLNNYEVLFVSNGIVDRQFNLGDCICFDNNVNKIDPVMQTPATDKFNPNVRILKIKYMFLGPSAYSLYIHIVGELLDNVKTCNEKKLVWHESEISFYKKDMDYDTFSVYWGDKKQHEPNYIDWNTLDLSVNLPNKDNITFENVRTICEPETRDSDRSSEIDSQGDRSSEIDSEGDRSSEYIRDSVNSQDKKTVFFKREETLLGTKYNTVVLEVKSPEKKPIIVKFKKNDCIQIPDKTGAISYVKIDDIQKLAMNNVKNEYEDHKPKKYSIYKIVGRLYTANGWRTEQSIIKFHGEFGVLTFTHNNRTRAIQLMNTIKVCPSPSIYSPTHLDTIGDLSFETYNSDYKDLTTIVTRQGIEVNNGTISNHINIGDCLQFDNTLNNIKQLKYTNYWYIFKITNISYDNKTNTILIEGQLLDMDKMQQTELIWNPTTLYFKGNSENGFFMEWNNYNEEHIPTHIDWNTLDLTKVCHNDSELQQLIEDHKNPPVLVTPVLPIAIQSEELPDRLVTIIIDKGLYVELRVTSNKTTKSYFINDCIHFENDKFKITDIISDKQLKDNYVDFIIKGYLWLEDKQDWSSTISGFYSINDSVMFISKTDSDISTEYQIDWKTINISDTTCPEPNPIAPLSTLEGDKSREPTVEQLATYSNSFEVGGKRKTISRKRKFNTSRKHL
jgi:hypothetical protein